MGKRMLYIVSWFFVIIGVVSNVCTIAATYFLNDNSKPVITIALSISLLFAIIFACVLLFTQKNDQLKQINVCSQMQLIKNKNINASLYQTEKNFNDNTLTNELLQIRFYEILKEEVEFLSKCLTNLTGSKVCVSIKEFVSESCDLRQGEVKIVVRSTNTDIRRCEYDHKKIKISQVPDFINISLSNEKYFYSPNLKKETRYERDYDWTANYMTKIVVPILAKDDDTRGYGDWKAYGFVSVDSNKKYNFEDNIDAYLNYIYSSANDIFFYVKEYKNYSAKLQGLEEVS